jgi:hypothetical protein
VIIVPAVSVTLPEALAVLVPVLGYDGPRHWRQLAGQQQDEQTGSKNCRPRRLLLHSSIQSLIKRQLFWSSSDHQAFKLIYRTHGFEIWKKDCR